MLSAWWPLVVRAYTFVSCIYVNAIIYISHLNHIWSTFQTHFLRNNSHSRSIQFLILESITSSFLVSYPYGFQVNIIYIHFSRVYGFVLPKRILIHLIGVVLVSHNHFDDNFLKKFKQDYFQSRRWVFDSGLIFHFHFV